VIYSPPTFEHSEELELLCNREGREEDIMLGADPHRAPDLLHLVPGQRKKSLYLQQQKRDFFMKEGTAVRRGTPIGISRKYRRK
jgi:hypothetical protein